MMILSIKDTGVGMTKEEIATIFSLNHSSTTTGTQGETGTGLGLLLCKEFIEKNNGKIWIESELNVGSTFYIALPTIPKI
jgi:signal transduction histidine kinase